MDGAAGNRPAMAITATESSSTRGSAPVMAGHLPGVAQRPDAPLPTRQPPNPAQLLVAFLWRAEQCRGRAHGGVVEQVDHRDVAAQPAADLRLHAQHQQRMPAPVEEVVVDADLVDSAAVETEHGAPDVRD